MSWLSTRRLHLWERLGLISRSVKTIRYNLFWMISVRVLQRTNKYKNYSCSWAVALAGLPEHTYTQSVRQCAQCAKSSLMTNFVHTFWGRLHIMYTVCGPKKLFANFFWTVGHLMHTFPCQDLTSCTLFKAVFRNLCILALHPLHAVRPPIGCPVPPGPPSTRPAWINLCGVCVFISGIRASSEAHCVRQLHARSISKPR